MSGSAAAGPSSDPHLGESSAAAEAGSSAANGGKVQLQTKKPPGGAAKAAAALEPEVLDRESGSPQATVPPRRSGRRRNSIGPKSLEAVAVVGAIGTVTTVGSMSVGQAEVLAAQAAEAEEEAQLPEQEEEEEESEEMQTLWQAAFTFFPAMASILASCAAEAIEAGMCQIIFIAALPVIAWVRFLLNQQPAPTPGSGIAPPPPPHHPSLMVMVQARTENYAEAHPINYMAILFGVAFAIGIFYLFLKDITDMIDRWRSTRVHEKVKSRYSNLNDEEAGGAPEEEEEADEVKSTEDLVKELRAATEACEILEIKVANFAKSTSEKAIEDRMALKELQNRRNELRTMVHGVSSGIKVKSVKAASKGARAGADEPAKKEPPLVLRLLQSSFMKTVMRSAAGIMAISIYFADLISDVQVLQLLWVTENYLWAASSLCLLVAQFLVVYLRVIPYLNTTFGPDSAVTICFVWLGFPTGLLFLDFLMFLEPFGLLTVLPFPDWLRQFVPAYKATRIIAEVFIESLPQCILQGFIYIVVIKGVAAGTATPSQEALYQFAALLPKSIFISVVAMLKTWIELVMAARQAGLSVYTKGLQLWQVGGGLPLDALKKGTILEFTCPYKLEANEVPPLLDALGKNASLTHLDLSLSGIRFAAPGAAGSALVELMNKSANCLSELQTFIISPSSGFSIPCKQIRSRDGCLNALRASDAFSLQYGPRREDVLFMAELRRRNLDPSVVEPYEETTGEAVAKLLADARRGKIKRDDYQGQLMKFVTEGCMRRGHLLALISADALRAVGYMADHLLATGFQLSELRQGGYTAAEMKATKLKASELREGGYTAGQLKGGGFAASQLKAAGYTAAELKAGGFVARQLKAVGFSALELKDNGFSATELREGTFSCVLLAA